MVTKPIEQGIKVIGTLRGYAEIPWRNDPSKVNRKIGIAIETVDSYGCPDSINIDLDVPYGGWQKYQSQAEMLKGKVVEINIGVTAKKGGKTGAWLSYYIVSDTDIVPATSKQPQVKAAS